MRKTKRPIKNKKMTGRKGGYVKQRTIRGGLTINGVHVPGTGRFLESSESRYGEKVQGVDYPINPTKLDIIRANIYAQSTEENKLLTEFEKPNTLGSIIQKIGYTNNPSESDLELMRSALTNQECMSIFIYLYVRSKDIYGNTTSFGLGETKKSGGLFTSRSRIRLFVVQTARLCVKNKIIVKGKNGPVIDNSKWMELPVNDVGGGIVFNKTALDALTPLPQTTAKVVGHLQIGSIVKTGQEIGLPLATIVENEYD